VTISDLSLLRERGRVPYFAPVVEARIRPIRSCGGSTVKLGRSPGEVGAEKTFFGEVGRGAETI